MPIRKKYKGGIIDDPINCNNDTTPVDLDDINSDSDIIYVGDKLEGNKYNCFKPTELKDIIIRAIGNKNKPANPLNRQELNISVIKKVVELYPNDFTDKLKENLIILYPNDFKDDNNLNDVDHIAYFGDFEFRYYKDLRTFNFDEYEHYIRDMHIFSTIYLIIDRYPDVVQLSSIGITLRANRLNIPETHYFYKLCKILNLLYYLNNQSIKTITSDELITMIMAPHFFQITTGHIADDIIGLIIYNPNKYMDTRINEPPFQRFIYPFQDVYFNDNWIGLIIKAIAINRNHPEIQDPNDFLDSFMINTSKYMIRSHDTIRNIDYNVMVIISFTPENNNDLEYRAYIRDFLRFYNTPISSKFNELYYIYDSNGKPMSRMLRGGIKSIKRKSLRKIIYKRKSSKNKKSKKKSSKRTRNRK
jgi:hypothetical protein